MHFDFFIIFPFQAPCSIKPYIIFTGPSFGVGIRGANILKSIKEDYKNETGLELDVNIMTSQQFNQAKGGEFKKSVEANS
ncbi:hypothetical protein, partial [Umezakia ovalisporum]|uniref:hypothetical protein n=1 Tax=Umezakia ovalisporum TaxID=75695 RepID=UPI0039C6FF39